jgi:hypothetical protein
MSPKTISLIFDENGNDSGVKRKAIVETLLTGLKPVQVPPSKQLIGSYTVSFGNKTVLYGHTKDNFNENETFTKLRAESMMRSHDVNLVMLTTASLTLNAKEDLDTIPREHGGIIICPLLGTGYFWHWVPEWSKNCQNKPVFVYLVEQLAALSGVNMLSESVIDDLALLEGGKIEFISYDTRNPRYVFCTSILEESLSDSVLAEDLDLFLFKTKDSTLFGSAHVILSGCSTDTAEYKYLSGCADEKPLRIPPNSTVVIDRKKGTHRVKFINTQAIVKGVN